MKYKGKFVVIDGGDGTGKTSVINFLRQKFAENDILFTREPGGTPFAESIRTLLLQERTEHVFAETELMLFCASRLQHIGNVVIPAINEGRHVICDRFALSTVAYQLYGNGRLDLFDFFGQINTVAVSGCIPSLYILLDVKTEIALQRRHKAGATTHFDKKDAEYHAVVRQGFLDNISLYPNGAIVDAGKSEEEVQCAVYDMVKKHLSL